MKINNIYILVISTLLTSCESFNKVEYKALYHQPFGFFATANKVVENKEVIVDEYVTPLNTSVLLTMYNQQQLNEVADLFDSELIRLHKLADRYHSYTDLVNLKTVNDSYGLDKTLTLSDELFELIKLGVDLTKLSKGKFNLAMGSLIDIYGNDYNGLEKKFEYPNTYNTLPEKSIIEEALSSVPTYENIDKIIQLDSVNKTIKFNKLETAKSNVVISLGAISKGFVVDKLISNVFSNNDYPAIINAGNSTISLLNNNPLKDNWTLALNAPNIFKEADDYLATFKLNGSYNVSTSADNQQNFLYKDESGNISIYHHILDSNTGVSNSYHRSVSILSNNATNALLDGCSTTIYNIESNDEIDSFIKEIEQTYNCNLSYFIANKNDNFDQYDLIYLKNSKNLINSIGKMVINITER